MTMALQFADMRSWSSFFDVVLFFFFFVNFIYWSKCHVNIITDSWVMKIFLRNWPEIRKSEIPQSEFCPINWDWDKLGMLKLAIKCCWMLQNSRVTTFTVSEILRENHHPPRLGLRILFLVRITLCSKCSVVQQMSPSIQEWTK